MRAAALALITVLTVGCGGGAPADANATPKPPDAVSSECAAALAGLTDALIEIDSRLNVGLTYANYSDRVATARVAYDKIKPTTLEADCLTGVASPEEDILNEYIDAYNVWNECIAKTGCTNDSIMTELQGHWTKATGLLTAVKKRLP